MYIRTRDDALDALAVILELPDRRSQIIEATLRIALCLDADPRNFLFDCQSALIEKGLESLRQRRHEQLASLARRAPPRPTAPTEVRVPVSEPATPYVILPEPTPPPLPARPEPAPTPALLSPNMLLDPLLEEVGTALDLLKVVDIVCEIFPRLASERPKWEIARYIFRHEEEMRATIVLGLRSRGDAAALDRQEPELLSRMDDDKPWWIDWISSLLETCRQAVATVRRFRTVHPSADDPELLLNIIMMSEERARELLDTVTKSPSEAVEYVSDIRLRVDWVLTAEKSSRA